MNLFEFRSQNEKTRQHTFFCGLNLNGNVSSGEGVGSQVNQFKQVSSNDHQMSVGGERMARYQVRCLEGRGRFQVWCLDKGRRKVGRSQSDGGGSTLPCDLFHYACNATYLAPPCEQTDTYKNITFPRFHLQPVNTSNIWVFLECFHWICWILWQKHLITAKELEPATQPPLV